ncbi:MAG TPA: hypothetical protein VGF45_06290 [Polyangia bacterium]
MRNRHATYSSFEELERDEFRRMETLGASVEEMIEAIFGEEVRVRTTEVDDPDDE